MLPINALRNLMKIKQQLEAAKEASSSLLTLTDRERNEVLESLAQSIEKNISKLLKANEEDLARMEKSDPRYDRLLLTEERLHSIAQDIRNVAKFPSPIGNSLEKRTLGNGLLLERITVPLGVVGVVYEARPNVTFDVFTLCFKSGNAAILKGGSDAASSNQAILELIHSVLPDKNCVQLLPPTRDAVAEMLVASDYIDVVIPRGSKALIDYVRAHSKVPVIETGAGVVHLYVDKHADLTIAKNLIFNAKTRRVSVCNALDTLLLHKDHLNHLAEIVAPLAEKNVEIFADAASFTALKDSYPYLQEASDEHFGCEFLDYKMSIRTVNTQDEALAYIDKHSSRHSETIVSTDPDAIERFFLFVDASAVYSNASTAFTDGAQFGLGAEIGISTQKLPPRGPMALRDLVSYKWLIRGNGQTRP